MSTLPRWLMVGGFLAGYAVLFGISTLNNGDDLIGVIVGFVWYAVVYGGVLSVPWVLLPAITNEPRQSRRILVAVLAGLLPAVFVFGAITYHFTGGDAPPTVLVSISLTMAVCFLPAYSALALTVARGTRLFSFEKAKIYPVIATVICVLAPLVVVVFTAPVVGMGGWVTRTESPTAGQVAHARKFLLINPEVEIEPMGFYEKGGMDYMVRFKFIARTDDAKQIFDSEQVDPSTFQEDFEFQPGEETHNEHWWDISAHSLTGGRFQAHDGPAHLELGFTRNDDNTITTYVWRHE